MKLTDEQQRKINNKKENEMKTIKEDGEMIFLESIIAGRPTT